MLVGEKPRKTALAFAIGVFLGFSPFIGLHTVLGLLVAYAFRLNKVSVLVGVYTNIPWVVLPYYGFATWFGMRLTGFSQTAPLPEFGFRRVLELEFWRQLAPQLHLLLPAAIGSTVLALILAAVAYWLAFHTLTRLAGSQSSSAEPGCGK